MTLEELQKTREFQQLTPKQRLFVSAYCDFGLSSGDYDSVEAAHIAYATRNKEVARVMSYSLLQNFRIIEVLNLHFGMTPNEEFLVQLNRAIRNKKVTPSQVQALRVKCDFLNIGSRIPYENHASTVPQRVIDATKVVPAPPRKKTPVDQIAPPTPSKEYGF
jgi:phage-related baseplate assembly protein